MESLHNNPQVLCNSILIKKLSPLIALQGNSHWLSKLSQWGMFDQGRHAVNVHLKLIIKTHLQVVHVDSQYFHANSIECKTLVKSIFIIFFLPLQHSTTRHVDKLVVYFRISFCTTTYLSQCFLLSKRAQLYIWAYFHNTYPSLLCLTSKCKLYLTSRGESKPMPVKVDPTGSGLTGFSYTLIRCQISPPSGCKLHTLRFGQ